MHFKAIVAQERVLEITDFEAMQESCIWLTWRINGRKLGQTRSSKQVGASNSERMCSNVEKGYNWKHLQKRCILMCPLTSDPIPKCLFLLELVSHTFSGKTPFQKEGFRQGDKSKQKTIQKLKPSSTENSWITHTVLPQASNELRALLKLKTWPWGHYTAWKVGGKPQEPNLILS